MKIWIDLANAPHVSFFLPLIRQLEDRGHEVKITLRDFNNTVEIAREHGINGHVVGKHGGKGNFRKLLNLAIRAFQLVTVARQWKPDVSVSHNSYTHTIAGRLIGSYVITLMDFEGQPANHIAFRFAHKVLVPDCFPETALRQFGARRCKVHKYSGFKEQLYLSNYRPDTRFIDALREACGLSKTWDLECNIVVTVRTPATMAAYHNFENKLFGKLLTLLSSRTDLTVVVLPRSNEQKEYLRRKFNRLIVPNHPLIGADLVYHSDILISAGGTMNREAAILGTQAYSLFAGEVPAVDRRLVELGRLTVINSLYDLRAIRLSKTRSKKILKNSGLCDEIVEQLLAVPGNRIAISTHRAAAVLSVLRTTPPIRMFKFYYFLKKIIPRRVQVDLRRLMARQKRKIHWEHWPIDVAAGHAPKYFKGWPDGRQFAFVLRHDVESPAGLRRVGDLVRLESRLGFRSAYYFVPQAYDVPPQLLEELRQYGNEVGVHGWNHDGKLYFSRSIFEKRADQINKVIEEWHAEGFASPSTHRNFEWLHKLKLSYDSSSFDTDPFEPQPDGVGTIFPIIIRNVDSHYVELPYTLPQDFTLYVILGEKDTTIWTEKLDWIAEKGGMVLLNTHPDYLSFHDGVCHDHKYPIELYTKFLEYVYARYEGVFWHALPREVAHHWIEMYGKETYKEECRHNTF